MNIPATIGRYRITREIARTDLSRVFAAEDAEGSPVCIKSLLPDLAKEQGAAALGFRREAALLAEVSHPNVVEVLEVGEDEGVPFTCLELLEGHTLADRLAAGPVPVVEAIDYLEQVAAGLSKVHERGIVHGDLKPDNVLLVPRGQDGKSVVKIVDFGLATEVSSQTDLIAGTPHYMAPEQTRLVDWPVDARSDLYSLGVMAYELLTGSLPFEAEDPAALLAAQIAQVPARLTESRSDIPPTLDRMVRKLLEKNPSDRYRSANGLASDLRQLREKIEEGDANPDFLLDTLGNIGERIGQVFVGRSQELDELETALERARQGRPASVFVGGVAGVGKSMLLREFRNRSITSGVRFAAGKCTEFARAQPYYVVAEALADHLKRLQQATQAERDATLERVRTAVGDLGGELVKIIPAYADVFPDASEASYLGEGRDQVRFLQMLARLLEALAPPGMPTVLMLDDLQSADAGSLQAIEMMGSRIQDCSVLVLATFRSEEVDANHPLADVLKRLETKAGYARLDLRSFNRQQTATMVAESLLVPVSALPDEVVTRIYERTEGNPLFVTEVIKALLATGAVAVRAGSMEFSTERFEATDLPASIVDTVLRRIEHLEEKSLRVLGAGALVGRGFNLSFLSHVTGLSAEEAFDAVNEGVSHGLLQPPRGGVYRFQHDRLREACRTLIPEPDHRELHQRMVEWLEAQGGEVYGGDAIFELAEHATQSEDCARGWRYCRAAGERAEARYANQQALEFYERALRHAEGLAGVHELELRQTREKLAGVLVLLGRYQEAGEQYELLITDGLERDERARLLSRVAETLQRSGRHEKAERALVEALELLGVRVSSARGRLALLLARARYFWTACRVWLVGPGTRRERDTLIFQILHRLWILCGVLDAKRMPYIAYQMMAAALALGPSRELCIAHRLIAVTLATIPHPPWERALRHGKRSVEVARQIGALLDVGIAMLYTSDIFCWSARFKQALPWLEGAREILSSQGNMWELGNTHIFSYLAYRGAGRFDDAIAHAHALLELGERLEAKNTIANAHQKVADILLLRGEDGRAQSHLKRSFELAETHKLTFERFSAHKVAGGSHLARNEYADARAHFESAVRLVEAPGGSFLQAYISDAYLGYAEAVLKDSEYLARTGGIKGEEFARAERYAREALERERHLLGHLGIAHRTHALCLWRRRKFSASRSAFQRALRVLREQDRPADVAWTELEAAEALGDTYPSEAVVWLRRARIFFLDQRLRPLAKRVDEALRRLGEPVESKTANDERSVRALEELIQTSQLLLDSRDPEVLLERIVESTIQLLGAERGFIFTRDSPEDELSLRLGRSADGSPVKEAEANISRSVIAEVDESGEGVAVSDTQYDASMRERRSVLASNIRSVLAAPLIHGSNRFGVLYIDSQITQALFGPAELKLLSTFAVQAALAMHNARQFWMIQEMNRNLDSRVRERTREVESAYLKLEESMDLLKNTTLRLAELEKEALEKELEVARSIQLRMVPEHRVFERSGARIVGLIEPASQCGGDLWTFAERDRERTVILVGDVTGHGVGAAMITTVAKSCLDTLHLERGNDISLLDLLRSMHLVMRGVAKSELMMTAFVVEIDPRRRRLKYCSAGHNPQMLLSRAKGEVHLLHTLGTRLGDLLDQEIAIEEVDYMPSDRLVLHTDGVIECADSEGREYGARRLRKAILSTRDLDAPEALRALRDGLDTFCAGEPPEDDITLVVVDLM